ncbi:MAG: nucleotide exchange factor GrpE [Planctomycetota bacterium]
MSDEQGGHEDQIEQGHEAVQDEGMTIEEAEAIGSLARSGDLEVPVGGDDLAEALMVLAADRDELKDKLTRSAADFQNFQRRARLNEDEARRQGMTGVVQSVITVMDHFDLALTQNPDTATAESILGGVRVIKQEMVRVLSGHGVTVIEPEAGTEFDPNRHEAIMRQPNDEHESGTVVMTMQAGYALGDRVIRPAKVAVSEGAAEGEE